MPVGAVAGRRAASRDETTTHLTDLVVGLYGSDRAGEVLSAVDGLVTRAGTRAPSPPLDQSDSILIAYGDHIRADGEKPLATLQRFMDEHLTDVIDGVHILPFHPAEADGGFSISDHSVVDPRLGTWDDVRAIGSERMLMIDCVLNHVSSSHPWFKGFAAGDERYADYFIRQTSSFDILHVVRPRATPLFTSFEGADGPFQAWTTFGPDQVDLNYRNPRVLVEVLDMIVGYVEHGARLLRLDATHFIWKESGTACVHLPQVHQIIQVVRAVIDLIDPSVVVVNETNVPHAENCSYFGDGHDEAQMVYNFALPTLIAHSIQTGNAEAITQWASTLAPPSRETCFFNHTACHDGISMRGSSEILQPRQRLAMVERSIERGGGILYRSSPTGDVPYEMCITYFDILSEPGDPFAVDRFIVSQAIQFALCGVPAIYFSNLFGAHTWVEGKELEGGVRNANRERYSYDTVTRALSDPATREAEVFRRIADLLRARSAEPAFHPNGHQQVLDAGERVFAVERFSLDESRRVRAFHNVSDDPVTVTLEGAWVDLLDDTHASGAFQLGAHSVRWIRPLSQ